MEKTMVSILCATYNHRQYIRKAIESFLAQKADFAFEVIVHDDASTDGTTEIVRELQSQYPKIIHAILQTENQYSRGVSIMDIMLKAACGKYVAFCEGDDYWISPHKLQTQVRYMEEHPDCALCVHAAVFVDAEGKNTGMQKRYEQDRVVAMQDIFTYGGGLAATASYLCPAVLRKQPMPEFFTCNPQTGDTPLQLYLATQGYVWYMAEPMACHRRGHAGSWCTRTLLQGDREVRMKFHQSYILMYRSFDQFTNQRWHDAVEDKIREIQLNILLLDQRYQDVFHQPYLRASRALKRRDRIKLYIKGILQKLSPRFLQAVLQHRKTRRYHAAAAQKTGQ